MSQSSVDTTVHIMGKAYQVKCPATEIHSLQQAAQYLEEKMQALHEAGNTLGIDRIAIITALNIVHQLLTLEQQKNQHLEKINQRLSTLKNKIIKAEQPMQRELLSAE